MTGEDLILNANYIISHAVGRSEIDDFARNVIEYLKAEIKANHEKKGENK